MDPYRPGDVLELLLAEIDEALLEPVADVLVSRAGEDDSARLANPLQTRGDVDPVAHQVAVLLLDHVAEVDADTKFDARPGRCPRIALAHRALDFDRAAHRVDHASE